MVKKLLPVLIMMLSVLNLQAGNFFECIPAQSKVRDYCLKNLGNDETVSLTKWLEKAEQLPKQESDMKQLGTKIAKIEEKIKQLEKQYNELQNENIENYEQYLRLKKAKLEVDIKLLLRKKAEIEKEYISLDCIPKNPSFQKIVNTILKKVDNANCKQELEYIKEGLSNVYCGKIRQWNTYTTKEKIGQITIPLVIIGGFVTVIASEFYKIHLGIGK